VDRKEEEKEDKEDTEKVKDTSDKEDNEDLFEDKKNQKTYLVSKPPKKRCDWVEGKPLLYMATTFMEDQPESRTNIQKNSIHMFKLLAPVIKIVVFAEKGGYWETYAKGLGLEVTNNFRLNSYGAPILRSVLSHLEEKYYAPFYGYVNGDILFSEDLKSVMKGVYKSFCEDKFGEKLLATGKRRNLAEAVDVVNAKNPFQQVYELKKVSKTFLKEALDYFIMTPKLFDWDDKLSFPDYVIGRPNYDNAIALMTKRTGGTIIDMSMALTVIHQNDEFGDFSGDRKTRVTKDRQWNLRVFNLMNLSFQELRGGHVGLAHYRAESGAKGQTIFAQTSEPLPSSIYPYKDEE